MSLLTLILTEPAAKAVGRLVPCLGRIHGPYVWLSFVARDAREKTVNSQAIGWYNMLNLDQFLAFLAPMEINMRN